MITSFLTQGLPHGKHDMNITLYLYTSIPPSRMATLSYSFYYQFLEYRWTFLAPMAECRSGHGVGVMGSTMYAVGGHDGVHYLNTVESFDTHSGEWHNFKPMGTSRAVVGIAILNNIPSTNVWPRPYCEISPYSKIQSVVVALVVHAESF